MKWLQTILIVVLIVFGIWMINLSLNQSDKINETNEQLLKLRKAYAALTSMHDTLDAAYATLVIEFDKMDSVYRKRLELNTLEYEKIIAGFDTLTIDEHVKLLSSYLSEEDSVRK